LPLASAPSASEAATRSTTSSPSWIAAAAPAAVLAACGMLTRPSAASARRGLAASARRPQRHVRHFFGGGKKEEGEEEEEGPEVLSEEAEAQWALLRDQIDELKAEAEEKRGAHERLKLEVTNFRTRTRGELRLAQGKAAIPIVKELLPIADEFDLAKQNLKVDTEGEQAIKDRFEALFDRMLDTWKEVGVEKMTSVGEDFNPEFHEAISMIPSGDYKEEVVCNEMRAGWVLKVPGSEDQQQVLRPSLVCVSAGPGPA